MTLGDRVPVEPLATDRLDRLERRVVAAAGPALARPARPALWPWGLALASAAAAALAVYALRPAPPVPPPAPLAVITDARGATLDLGEAQIAAGPETRYDVVRGSPRSGGGIDVRLDHGTVHLDVAPRKGRAPLWVRAGDVGVRVVGTAFTVARAPGDGEVTVEVEHGTVEVHRAGAIAAVTGGERWSSDDGTVIAMAARPTDDGAAGGPATGGDTVAGPLGADDRHTADLATGPAIDVAVLGGRTITVPGAGSGSGSTRVTPRDGARPQGDRAGSSKPVDVPPDPPGDLRSQIRGQHLAPAMSVPGATAAERVNVLRDLVKSTHREEAAAALYGLARTQHVELGQHAEALRSLDLYLVRFAKGAEREAVLWLRLRILCRGPYNDACRAAAHTYASEFPSGEPGTRGYIADRVTDQR